MPTSITVSGPGVTGSTVTLGSTTGTVQLSAVVLPAGAPQTVTWTSSDPTKATVSASGLVTGKVAGTVTITVASTGTPAVTEDVTVIIP